MSDLFEQVFHHIEGTETEIQDWHTLDGIKTVEFRSFGPDRWIESVHERGRMTGIECLAMILFEVDVSFSDPEPARRIVEDWAVELRKAVSAGEIQARDPVTLLKLETLPDGWEWLLSMTDADKFIAARGMEWRFGEVALHLFNEFKQAIENRRFPPWERETKQPAPAQTVATPEPVVAMEVRSGNVLTLPNGHTHVLVGALPLLIADAQWPDDGTDDEGWEINYATCEINSKDELKEAVQSGALPVKKPSTFAPLTYLKGNAWKTGLVTVADLQIYLAERGMTLKIADAPEPQATTPGPAPEETASASDSVESGKTGPAKPLQRTAAQDAAILCEIEKQGYDPLAIPKNAPGKRGAKAAIRTALSKNSLFTGGTVFDKAWERLTARADIAIQG